MSNIDRAVRVLNEHWSVAQESGQADEAECCVQALADAGLLAPDPPKPYLHPVTMWQAKCSGCGYIQDDYGDFTAMDAVGVIEQVQAGGWVLEDDRLVCDSCQEKEVEQ